MIKKVTILLWLGIFCDASTYALPTIPGPIFKIPPEIQAITDVDSLRQLLTDPDYENKIGICMRLGELGTEAELPLLIDVFNSEPYFLGIEAMPNIKHFSLISIGQIGGPTAEKFLRQIVTTMSPNIKAGTNSFTHADSLATIVAAIEGLGYIGTPWIGAFLDSIFEDVDNKRAVRSTAYTEALKIELKNNLSLAFSADTANYLIDKWKAVPWARTPFTTSGVSADYIVRTNAEALLYQYRSITLPYVEALEKELSADDPKLGALKELRERMEANPAEPKE